MVSTPAASIALAAPVRRISHDQSMAWFPDAQVVETRWLGPSSPSTELTRVFSVDASKLASSTTILSVPASWRSHASSRSSPSFMAVPSTSPQSCVAARPACSSALWHAASASKLVRPEFDGSGPAKKRRTSKSRMTPARLVR
jgi:hypothetical protein